MNPTPLHYSAHPHPQKYKIYSPFPVQGCSSLEETLITLIMPALPQHSSNMLQLRAAERGPTLLHLAEERPTQQHHKLPQDISLGKLPPPPHPLPLSIPQDSRGVREQKVLPLLQSTLIRSSALPLWQMTRPTLRGN